MLTETPQPSRPLAPLRDGEPCPSCGTPLAGDQRYCLQCGARRPEARMEFLDVLDADVRARSAGLAGHPAAFGSPPLPPGPPRGINARLQDSAGALALGALVLLTLLIGLLLGHWVSDARRDAAPAAATPAPQVIRVEGTAPAAGSGADAGTTGAGGDASADSEKGAKGGSKAKASSSEKATAPKDSVSVKNLTSKKAVDDAVKKGKPISTGTGKLPPKDDKPGGGGSGFEEIG